MARSPKYGVDYFPMQTDVASDPKITKLIRLGGVDAWTVFTWVLILTYREGYYSKIEPVIENIAFMFRDIPEDRIRECLQMLVDSELLDADLFSKGIISSHGIQRQYSIITSRRKEFPNVKYWLHKDELNSINVNNNQVELDKCMQKRALNSEPASKSTQKETETERETETEKETETETEASVGLSESDFDIPSYNPVAERINKILEKEIHMGYREYTFISNCADYFDERALEEAVMKAIQAKHDGRLRGNLLKYVEGTLRNWENGNGVPDYAKEEEARLAEQKAEYMKPSRFQEVFVDG